MTTIKDRKKELYKRYTIFRDEMGLTDYKVANKAGIAFSCIYDWKYGRSMPKIENMAKICRVLNIPLDYMAD